MFAVLGHRAARDGVTLFLKLGTYLLIDQRGGLVFVLDNLLQAFFDFADGELLPFIGYKTVVEEELQRIDAKVGLNVLAVAYA